MTVEARRQRPRDRKQQILLAASELFAEVGFHEATVGRIAETVGITPGALYRHYAGKEDLLAAVLLDYSDRILAPPTDGLPLEEVVALRAAEAARSPTMGVLWSREVRHLGEQHRRPIVERTRTANGLFARALRASRPGLPEDDAVFLSWAMLSVLVSTGARVRGLADDDLAHVLTTTCVAIAQVDLPPREPVRAAPSTLRPASRRENLLAEAGRLFGERGYQATSLADVGQGAGVTGPGVYSHFAKKEDLLDAALERAYHAVWLDLHHAFQRSRTPAEALDLLVASYVRLTHDRPHLVAGMVAEPGGLGIDWRGRQREYVEEWDVLLTSVRPDLGPGRAQVLVRAAMVVVGNLSRTRGLVGRPDMASDLEDVARAVLGAPVT